MRFLRLRLAPVSRAILVESGSRHLLEGAIPSLRHVLGEDLRFDLVTCYAGLPAGLTSGETEVFPIHEHRGREARKRLYQTLKSRRPSVLVMLCSGEPIMTKWKWALAFRLPVKVLVVNENSDFFWLDRSNWGIIRHFILVRAGLSGGDAVPTIARILVFPFTLAYLLSYAVFIHVRRKVHP